MFGKTTLYLSIFFIGLQFHTASKFLLYIVVLWVLGTISLFSLLSLKPVLSSFRSAFLWWTVGDLFMAMVSGAKPVPHFSSCASFLILCLYSSLPHSVSPFLQSSAVVPGCCILYKVTTLVVNILYRIAAFYCYLCKTVVVPQTNKNKTGDIHTGPVREIVVAPKPVTPKLQAGQEKLRQNKSDMSQGLENSL